MKKKQSEGRILFRLTKYFLPIILLYFVSCEDNGIEPINPEGIWPLKSGSFWLYKIEKPTWMSNVTLKMEITGTMTVNYGGQNYTVAKMAFYGIGEPMPEYQWLYWKGSDGVYFMGGVSPTDTFVVKELELKYPASVGDSWQYRSVAYSRDRKKFYISDTLTYSLVGKDVPFVTTAGSFKCYQYRFSQKPADDVGAIWDYNYYYSAGIGLIAEETKSQLDGSTKDKFVLLTYQVRQ